MKPPIDAPYILCMCVRMINTTLRIWMHTRTCISKQHTHTVIQTQKQDTHMISCAQWLSFERMSVSKLFVHCVSLWRPACMVVPLISSLALEKHSCLMLLVKASRASNPNVGLLLHELRRILLFQLSSHRVSYACCTFVGLPLSDLFGDASKTKWTQRARLRNRICHVNFSCCPYYNWLVVWNIFYFSIYWECHHPNWLSLHHFSEG